MSHLSFDGYLVLLASFGLPHSLSLSERSLPRFFRGHDFRIVQVYFINAIVNLCAVQLAEYVLAELIEAHEVSTFMLANEFIQVSINLQVILIKLLPEFLSIDLSFSIILKCRSYFSLVSIHRLASWSRHFNSLGPVKVLIIRLHGRHVRRVFLQISIIVESICNLGVLQLTHFLSADVVHEFSCGLDSNLLLNLLDESVGVHLASVESFVHVVQSSSGAVVELTMIFKYYMLLIYIA